MKNFLILLFSSALLVSSYAQQEGTIKFSRTVRLPVRRSIDGSSDGIVVPPKLKKDNFLLVFSGSKSIWKKNSIADSLNKSQDIENDDKLYIDWANAKFTELRKFQGNSYILKNESYNLKWEEEKEEKTILGFRCYNATATRVYTKMRMQIVDGNPIRKDVSDTLRISAWYTKELPANLGPEYYGGLPGAVLSIDINNGKQIYLATEYLKELNRTLITEPTGGKIVTDKEFNDEAEASFKKNK